MSQRKTALVTGSTSGIGLAIAERFAADSFNVVLNSYTDDGQDHALAAEMSQNHAGEVVYIQADMSKPDRCRALIAAAAERFGTVDVLVNNAGIQHVAKIEEFPDAKWDAIIAINLGSAFHATKAVIPHMKALGRGRIINMASAHGLVASPFKSAYVAAKHGLVGLTKTTALELAETGITANAICPGYVKTPLVEGQISDTAKARGISETEVVRDVMLKAQATKKFVEYDELVGLLLYLVSDAGASCTGATFPIDGGWTAS